MHVTSKKDEFALQAMVCRHAHLFISAALHVALWKLSSLCMKYFNTCKNYCMYYYIMQLLLHVILSTYSALLYVLYCATTLCV